MKDSMKKLISRGNLNKFRLAVYLFSATVFLAVFSCQPDETELGRDILPPGDNIFVHYDTLAEMNSYPISGRPYFISENPTNPDISRLFMLGNVRDTISGFAKADIVTHFNPTSSFRFGPNMVVDSLVLFLYFAETDFENENPINIKIHELTDRIYMDSVYYTDFDVAGKYNPLILSEKSIAPEDSTMYEFLIEDLEFINKFINPPNDTLFYYDSLFKDYFKGLYITTDDALDNGFLSKIHLSKPDVRLSLKYANDSTAIDTIEGYNFLWSNFSINEYSSQKINIFKHDYTGTSFEAFIDNPELQSPVFYIQGLNGVNTRLSLGGVENWRDSGLVAINNAELVFEVVPDSISGISIENLPDRLILFSDLGDNKNQPIYDFLIDAEKFDGRLRAETDGVFYDTTYVYRFNIGLHYQNLINGDIENHDLILQPYDSRTNNKFLKLWSNYYNDESGLRLKIIYTKLE